MPPSQDRISHKVWEQSLNVLVPQMVEEMMDVPKNCGVERDTSSEGREIFAMSPQRADHLDDGLVAQVPVRNITVMEQVVRLPNDGRVSGYLFQIKKGKANLNQFIQSRSRPLRQGST